MVWNASPTQPLLLDPSCRMSTACWEISLGAASGAELQQSNVSPLLRSACEQPAARQQQHHPADHQWPQKRKAGECICHFQTSLLRGRKYARQLSSTDNIAKRINATKCCHIHATVIASALHAMLSASSESRTNRKEQKQPA